MANDKLRQKITTRNPLTLLHISPKKNRASILRRGLQLDMENSGYGVKPTQNAVYLFHEDNINVIYETIESFGDFDIFEVKIYSEEFLAPDEDSGAKDWRGSIEAFGTVAHTASIDKRHIKLLCHVSRN